MYWLKETKDIEIIPGQNEFLRPKEDTKLINEIKNLKIYPIFNFNYNYEDYLGDQEFEQEEGDSIGSFEQAFNTNLDSAKQDFVKYYLLNLKYYNVIYQDKENLSLALKPVNYKKLIELIRASDNMWDGVLNYVTDSGGITDLTFEIETSAGKREMIKDLVEFQEKYNDIIYKYPEDFPEFEFKKLDEAEDIEIIPGANRFLNIHKNFFKPYYSFIASVKMVGQTDTLYKKQYVAFSIMTNDLPLGTGLILYFSKRKGRLKEIQYSMGSSQQLTIAHNMSSAHTDGVLGFEAIKIEDMIQTFNDFNKVKLNINESQDIEIIPGENEFLGRTPSLTNIYEYIAGVSKWRGMYNDKYSYILGIKDIPDIVHSRKPSIEFVADKDSDYISLVIIGINYWKEMTPMMKKICEFFNVKFKYTPAHVHYRIDDYTYDDLEKMYQDLRW